VGCPAAGTVAPAPKVALAASTLAAQASRVLGRTLSSRGVEVIQSSNERIDLGSRPAFHEIAGQWRAASGGCRNPIASTRTMGA
jgi:hypothetical protein